MGPQTTGVSFLDRQRGFIACHSRNLKPRMGLALRRVAVVVAETLAELLAMKTLSSLSEDLLMDQYAQPAFLPPLWRVIFQEAMRGHHLLFSKSILQSVSDDAELDGKTKKSLEEFCVHLFAAPDLKSIRTMISFLPQAEQKQLFVIYLKLMQTLKEENKSSLH
jgi:hypothetical protein